MSEGWLEVVDVSLMPRFKGEKFYINEFITPRTKMVQEIATRLYDEDEEEHVWNMFKWVVEEIRYPWREGLPMITMLICDLHVLFRHPWKPKLSICIMDYWKFPYETIRDKLGDCEDTSFLLCSLLRSYGYQAYAVLGKVIVDKTPYGHGWVEYKHPRYGWVILESTLESLDEFEGWEDYVEAERQVRDMYKPEIKFNESETKVISESVLKELERRFRR